jgi:hypothetical protein
MVSERFSGALFLETNNILMIVPAFFVVGHQFQIRQ